ncbi:MAG: hypothetical protein JSV91_05855 [Phycisphaerales bacterium]|nr:MAG: hypothetical protein JSV91_05855 [Phycisphaerales bacterium]
MAGLVIGAAVARGAVYVVTAGGTYPTIQSGINACTLPGDIVRVTNGVWAGPGNVNLDFLGKQITVQSTSGDPSACYIDGGLSHRGVHFNGGEGPGSVFEGIGIINGRAVDGGAIKINNYCSPTIRNVRLLNNGADRGGAIAIYLDSTSLIENCSIASNQAYTSSGGGVHIVQGSPTFRNTTIVNNTAVYGGGVYAAANSAPVFEDCEFSNNETTTGSGGALNLNNSDATLSNCTIQLNTAGRHGGGISLSQTSSIDVTGGTIRMNECQEDGGAARLVGGTATFTGVTFDDNTATQRGGGVYGEGGATMTFGACSFTDCSSGWGGGAIFSSESVANVTNCDFDINIAGTRGGAMRLRDSSHGDISGGTFTNNEATLDGGAISATHDSSIVVSGPSFTSNMSGAKGGAINTDSTIAYISDNCRFELNVAELSGGAIASTGGSELDVLDADFVANYAANSWGGGIHVEDAASEVLISGSVFDDNQAPSITVGSGAAVASFRGPIRIVSTDFLGNDAGALGGAVLADTGYATIGPGCLFQGNTAVLGGGGLYCLGLSSVDVTVSEFIDNESTDVLSRGGAISVDNGLLRMSWCLFESNRAQFGGGVHTYVCSVVADSCDFRENTTWTGGQGGGARHLAQEQSETIKYKWCRFMSNNAGAEGGAMYLERLGNVYVHNCGFFGNTTEGVGLGGGGVFALLCTDLELTNCAFSCNSTVAHGGAIHVDTVNNAIVANCTLSHNDATDPVSQGGGVFIANSTVDSDNCVFWENQDAAGNTFASQIFLSSGIGTVDWSCFTDPACPAPLGTNICDDPLFVDHDGPDDECGTEDDDLTLGSGSPCIDAGNNAAVPADVIDLDGDLDYGEQTPLDLKHEDRFVNDVDMGAYEFQGAVPCPADINGDDVVDIDDLFQVLNAWGPCDDCPEDINRDGLVDIEDIFEVLGSWGPCP